MIFRVFNSSRKKIQKGLPTSPKQRISRFQNPDLAASTLPNWLFRNLLLSLERDQGNWNLPITQTGWPAFRAPVWPSKTRTYNMTLLPPARQWLQDFSHFLPILLSLSIRPSLHIFGFRLHHCFCKPTGTYPAKWVVLIISLSPSFSNRRYWVRM